MKKIRCSVSFHRLRVGLVNEFGVGVRDGIYSHADVFVTPAIAEVAFQALLTDDYNKRIAYENGGPAQEGDYKAAREALMDALDIFAEYVDSIADGDENIILMSGFEPTKGYNSERPKPEQVTGVEIKRGAPGVLIAECDKQDVAIYYGCILSAGQPLPPEIIISQAGQIKIGGDSSPNPPDPATGSETEGYGIIDLTIHRRKEFTNLTPGVIYYFVFYAVNAQGVGSVSNAVSIMCV
jgi:hypothetical protein